MGMTLIEKIIAHNIGREKVSPGEIVTVNVDRVMVHDIFIPFVAEKFEEMGFSKIWDPDRMVLIYDHLVPASQLDDARHFAKGDAFAAKYGVKHVHRSDGICHQLMTEAGYVLPGDIAFGTDSHTVTYGCVGAFSTGIGYTEMAGILGTGKLWIRIPETIKVEVNGTLPSNVTSKDVILQILGDLRADGATYKSLEFTGDTFDAMSVASRMTMSNMTVECGAKCGLFSPDEKTAEYCDIDLDVFRQDTFMQSLHGDPDAVYDRVMTYRAEDFVPVAACPSQVDNIHPVNKRVVGERLYEEAMDVVYHRPARKAVFALGKYTVENTLHIRLSAPVTAREKGEYLLEIAGQDGVYRPAQVSLSDSELLLSHPQIQHPISARYAWTDYAIVRLFGPDGLPLAPFWLR